MAQVVHIAKRNVRGVERRATILRAAVEVVARGGAGALTHRAVAAQAGVSLASITYHFPSVDDLRRATLIYAADVVGTEFAASFTCGGDERAIIEELAVRWRHIGLTHRGEFSALFSLLVEALHDPELRSDVDELIDVPTRMLTQSGISAATADALIGSLIGLALVALARDEPESALGQFDAAVAALLEAFGSSCSPSVRES